MEEDKQKRTPGNLKYDNRILKLNRRCKMIKLRNSQKIKSKDKEKENRKEERRQSEDQSGRPNILMNRSSKKRGEN